MPLLGTPHPPAAAAPRARSTPPTCACRRRACSRPPTLPRRSGTRTPRTPPRAAVQSCLLASRRRRTLPARACAPVRPRPGRCRLYQCDWKHSPCPLPRAPPAPPATARARSPAAHRAAPGPRPPLRRAAARARYAARGARAARLSAPRERRQRRGGRRGRGRGARHAETLEVDTTRALSRARARACCCLRSCPRRGSMGIDELIGGGVARGTVAGWFCMEMLIPPTSFARGLDLLVSSSLECALAAARRSDRPMIATKTKN